MSSASLSNLNSSLQQNLGTLAQQFAQAQPFKHICIDDFFEPGFAQSLLQSFPAFDEQLAINEDGFVGAKAVHEKITSLGPPWQTLDQLVQSDEFKTTISSITGIPALRYDPHYFGGGTHENRNGQGLAPHVDFNLHPITRQHRRLNLIVYLNNEWQESWGGSIQLHRDPYLPPELNDVKSIAPVFNRCVIFETNEHSWHGFPRIQLPAEKSHLSRKSFALYNYTDSRPATELAPEHSTVYVEEHLREDIQPGATLSAEQMQHIQNLLASRDQHLRRLYGQIKMLYTELNHLKECQGVQAAAIADEAWDATALSPNEQELHAQLRRQRADIARAQARITELQQSTSWRVTAPLRLMASLLRQR